MKKIILFLMILLSINITLALKTESNSYNLFIIHTAGSNSNNNYITSGQSKSFNDSELLIGLQYISEFININTSEETVPETPSTENTDNTGSGGSGESDIYGRFGDYCEYDNDCWINLICLEHMCSYNKTTVIENLSLKNETFLKIHVLNESITEKYAITLFIINKNITKNDKLKYYTVILNKNNKTDTNLNFKYYLYDKNYTKYLLSSFILNSLEPACSGKIINSMCFKNNTQINFTPKFLSDEIKFPKNISTGEYKLSLEFSSDLQKDKINIYSEFNINENKKLNVLNIVLSIIIICLILLFILYLSVNRKSGLQETNTQSIT